MRLIDADAFVVDVDIMPEGGYLSPHDLISLINARPTIEERKKGKWIETDSHEPCWYKCDQCGRLHDFLDAYCPNCGADMRGDTWEH